MGPPHHPLARLRFVQWLFTYFDLIRCSVMVVLCSNTEMMHLKSFGSCRQGDISLLWFYQDSCSSSVISIFDLLIIWVEGFSTGAPPSCSVRCKQGQTGLILNHFYYTNRTVARFTSVIFCRPQTSIYVFFSYGLRQSLIYSIYSRCWVRKLSIYTHFLLFFFNFSNNFFIPELRAYGLQVI